MVSASAACFLLLPLLAVAHICFIWPPQRGGWNPRTAEPGDDVCFQPRAACGTKPIPTAPTDSLAAGTTLYVKFQQNLNHYNPGYPGFLDVGYAVGPNHASDDDFQILAQIPDYWPHRQASQTNFSVPILVPSTPCEWCTLRIRYHPNKPSEPIFHQCADIKIVPSTASLNRRVFGLVQSNHHSPISDLVEVLGNGQLEYTNLNIDLLKREEMAPTQFVASGLISPKPDASGNTLYFIGDSLTTWQTGNSPNILFRYNLDSKKFEFIRQLKRSGRQWNALLKSKGGFYAVQQVSVNSSYAYRVSSISVSGDVVDIGTSFANSTYVNFFWAAYDPVNSQVYILTGDEDSLYNLGVVLCTVSLTTGQSSSVILENSEFTVSNLYVDENSGTIYSVSPGLYGRNDYTIVTINPKNGAVLPVSKVEHAGEWASEYGGGVYNGISADGTKLLHQFTWADTGATLIASVEIKTGKVLYFTDINLGINNEGKINSVVAV